MDDSHPGNISFLRSFRLLSDLHNFGVKHVVISPGSRSTPLTLAAAAHPGLIKHVHIDERSAAFMALGIGKITQQPAVLICTSGTALANYYPAVVEARMSSTPLIILSADRPPKDRVTGAPQTINQIRIFGNYPVYFTDAPLPSADSRNEDQFRLIAHQAWTTAISAGGPVHVNLPFDKPLEPTPGYPDHAARSLLDTSDILDTPDIDMSDSNAESDSPDSGSKTVIKSDSGISGSQGKAELSNKNITGRLINSLTSCRRPLVILGPSNAIAKNLNEAVRAFTKAGIPVLSAAGSTSSEPGICGFDAFLRQINTDIDLRPDLILRTGLHPASKGIELFLEACLDVEHIHFHGTDDFNDALQTVTSSMPLEMLTSYTASIIRADSDWLSVWTDRVDRFLKEREALLNHGSILTDGHVFNTLLNEIPEDWLVILSNSFPVRDYDLFKPANLVFRTVTNRGASGIDGITSTAAGSCIGSGQNGVLFIGDIAALHDSNGLACAGSITEQTLIVVVVNNGGGTIFRMLPVSGQPEVYTPFFETPQKTDFKALAQAHSVGYERADNREDLTGSFRRLTGMPGLHILECVTDADASMNIRNSLWKTNK